MNYSVDDREDPKIVKEWERANLKYDNLMFTSDEQTNVPYRQQFPGRQAGLSVVLDPDIRNYKCTNTDSEGYMLGLNVPLDMPKMKDNGIAIKTNSEVFVGIRPEIMLSHEAIRTFPLVKIFSSL